ncbi:D-alanyl-D-alanine carboxypeptidase/D-alanyl-D-alanine-endopeptidase [Streptomyces ferrugineus]|uniref:D-alanyl-D-alanine carboxypeptidase/D-alanyl-D-alanine-endopeptidase n=1 Tax=Streptomyces ferrugineus TaxID=1413221 RepID=A0A7M2SPQ9_9ACTN|nr:D-alanyl-D-alanine carboxypeptidase/D-alanyl-D-alanine-endopeptidase [Streptomyces ferrugineus]QOV37989.1 D-alanyl-D-alanine carboxypeptidase/D-alanyl-D-alanine-endopeptidase [Streptomyces ferrugineus]
MTRPVSNSGRSLNSLSRLWIWPVAVALVAAVLGPGAQAGADSDRSGLPEAVDAILGDARMEGGVASVVIADAGTGELLYQHLPSTRLMPASNTKLATSAAAMEVLGPRYRFRTDVLATGRRYGSVLRGDLYLRGTGDPTLLAADYDRLAARLAASGIRRVAGRLIADDTRFDDRRLGRSWAADDESSYYSAQISALSVAPDTDYDTGTVIVTVRPGESAGDRPAVTVTPGTGYVDLDVTATTVAAGGANDLTVEREHGTNTIVVSGTTPAGGAGAKEWVTVWEPTGYAATVFRDALADHGVKVTGPTRLGHPTPATARQLASHDSMPLKDLLVPFMKLSNNMHAEILTKAMGHKVSGEGSWGAGLAAIGGYLKGIGVDTGTVRQVDGSGLSRMDNFPAGQLVKLLLAVRAEPWYADWYRSLPVACDPDRFVGGTLRSRMCGTTAALNARAKTGSLTGASALSGFVTDAGGRELVYGIVLNNYLASSVKPLEDAIVVTLAKSTAEAAGSVSVRRGGARADIECSWRKPDIC